MKFKLKALLGTMLLLVGMLNLNGQGNLIPNPSFEIGNSFTKAGRFSRAQSWENYNTSDLCEDGGFESTTTAPGAVNSRNAHTGLRYAGFGPCEGGQVKLSNTVDQFSVVQIGYWYSRLFNSNPFSTEFRTFLLRSKGPGQFQDCLNPPIDAEYEDILSIDQSSVVAGQWAPHIGREFMIADQDYDWFAFKGRNTTGVYGDDEYLFVDDFYLKRTSYCDHECFGNLDSIQTSTLPNAMLSDNPDMFFILNATEIKLEIFSQFGGAPIYTIDAFDPNGLVNESIVDPVTGQLIEYFVVQWQGTDNNGNTVVPNDTYTFTLRYKNCLQTFNRSGTITWFQVSNPPFQNFSGTFHVNGTEALESCCIENWFYQNETISDFEVREVEDFIHAGENVTTGTNGPVIVEDGAYAFFNAGNSITLDPGFQVEAGGTFIAQTGYECPPQRLRGPMDNELKEIAIEAFLDSVNNTFEPVTEIAKSSLQYGLKVFPNPVHGACNIEIKSDNISYSNIKVVDRLGRTLIQKSLSESKGLSYQLDMSSLSSGTYWLYVERSGKVFSKSVVVK
ncbi:MAG: T9SS type A sorting domain-containing protein [Bacteroidota bacterium]